MSLCDTIVSGFSKNENNLNFPHPTISPLNPLKVIQPPKFNPPVPVAQYLGYTEDLRQMSQTFYDIAEDLKLINKDVEVKVLLNHTRESLRTVWGSEAKLWINYENELVAHIYKESGAYGDLQTLVDYVKFYKSLGDKFKKDDK